MSIVPGLGTSTMLPQYPQQYTPDAGTAAVTPGAAYQPLPGLGGEIRGDFETHPGDDGFYVTSPIGTNTEWFDGNTLWNQGGMTSEVSNVLNLNNLLKDQASQFVQYSAGLSPYPPDFGFPYDRPTFLGTPANPASYGAAVGINNAGQMGFNGGAVNVPGVATNLVPGQGLSNPGLNSIASPSVPPAQ